MFKFRIRNKRYILDLKKFSYAILLICIVCGFILGLCHVVAFSELYSITARKALKNDIVEGNQKAIDYYNKHYTSKGVYLYGEDAEPESDFINLATVTSYEATEHGILLHTEDGNGYFIER